MEVERTQQSSSAELLVTRLVIWYTVSLSHSLGECLYNLGTGPWGGGIKCVREEYSSLSDFPHAEGKLVIAGKLRRVAGQADLKCWYYFCNLCFWTCGTVWKALSAKAGPTAVLVTKKCSDVLKLCLQFTAKRGNEIFSTLDWHDSCSRSTAS